MRKDKCLKCYRRPFRFTKTYVWDVEDLENPILQNIYVHNFESVDHNQYIIGEYTFQANYHAGFRILRIDQENYDLETVSVGVNGGMSFQCLDFCLVEYFVSDQ